MRLADEFVDDGNGLRRHLEAGVGEDVHAGETLDRGELVLRPGVRFAGLALGVHGGVDHLGDALVVDEAEHGGEADVAIATEDDVQGHVDLSVFSSELLSSDVDAAAGGDEDADSLVDDVDAVEDIDGGAVDVGGGDREDVDGVDETVDDLVATLDADDELAAGGGEGIVA